MKDLTIKKFEHLRELIKFNTGSINFQIEALEIDGNNTGPIYFHYTLLKASQTKLIQNLNMVYEKLFENPDKNMGKLQVNHWNDVWKKQKELESSFSKDYSEKIKIFKEFNGEDFGVSQKQ